MQKLVSFYIVITCINSGVYIEMNKWKETIYKVVKQHDENKWKVTCSLQKSLCYIYLKVHNMKMSPWWVHTAQNVTELKFVRCIVQFLLGKDRQEIGMCQLFNQQLYSIPT